MSEPTSQTPTSTPTPAEGANKRPADSKSLRKPPAKRKRFNKPSENVSFVQKTRPASLGLTPVKRFFQLHTSTNNLSSFFLAIYNVLINRDSKFAATSPAVFDYVCHLAFYFRLYNLGEIHGYLFSSRTAYLKRFAQALLLPEAVCKLIESIGLVKTTSGMSIVPYIPSNEEYAHGTFYTKLEDLAETIDNEPRGSFKTAISSQLIIQYIASTTRGYKGQMLFRKCEYEKPEGMLEFTVALQCENSQTRALSLEDMDEPTAITGGTYGFRTVSDKANWLGVDKDYFAYPFVSSSFEPVIQVSSRIVNDLNQK